MKNLTGKINQDAAAASLWAAVFIKAVRDYKKGKLSRSWFLTPRAVWIARVIIAAGVADDRTARAADIMKTAA
jgi:hypothetical protein